MSDGWLSRTCAGHENAAACLSFATKALSPRNKVSRQIRTLSHQYMVIGFDGFYHICDRLGMGCANFSWLPCLAIALEQQIALRSSDYHSWIIRIKKPSAI